MTQPSLTKIQRYFITCFGHRLRGNTLKSLFGFSPRGLTAHRIPTRRKPPPPLSLKGAKELWAMFKDDPRAHGFSTGMALNPTGVPGERWSSCEINHLSSWVGRKSVSAIARDCKRSRIATWKKLRRLELNQKAFDYTLVYVAKMLFISKETLYGWTRKASGDGKRRVRSYMEGRVNMVHIEDAEWLLENRKRARSGDFPDHPGSVDHFEKEILNEQN